jgi:hypothetical protein
MLAPREARAVPAERREQIGEYLLGQQRGEAERAATVSYLGDDAGARAWARALAAELGALGEGRLPELPAEPDAAAQDGGAVAAAAAAPATAAPVEPADGGSSLPVSRRAGAALLALLVAAIVLAVVLIPSGAHSSKNAAPTSAGKVAAGGTATSTGEASAPTQDKRITLRPTDAKSGAIGVALVLSEGSRYAFYLAAQHLPPTHGFFYAVWLYNSPTSHEPLGKSPAVGSNGVLQGGAFLPADAGRFHRMILTRETSEHPSAPGPIVLSGSFALH